MIFEFANCELDTGSREVHRDGEVQHVEPQVFDLLRYLIDNREKILSKEDLYAAIWDGRFVSETTLSSRINAARRAIGDNGKKQALIKTLPRRGFRFIGEVTVRDTQETGPQTGSDEALPPLPNKPSIAVLPFENMSGYPEQAYFADGMADEIITALSHVDWLFVIARNSSFSFRNEPIEAREAGRRLGVRYLLEGSVRRAGQRLRITAQLIEASIGSHLWAERYEGSVDEVFELQDRITESVVGAIQPKLRAVETALAQRKRPGSLDAYDHYLRGLALHAPQTPDAIEQAELELHKAIALDPNFAEALALLSWCRATRPIFGMSSAPEDDLYQARELAKRALTADPENSQALCYAGFSVLLTTRDYETAFDLYAKALERNPNSALTYLVWGWTANHAGDGNTAISKFKHGLRLSPSDPSAYQFELGLAFAHTCEGYPKEALRWIRRALPSSPSYIPNYRVLVAANAMLGKLDEARAAAARLIELKPDFTVTAWADAAPLKGTPGQQRMIQAMIEGGLPE